MTIKVTIGVCLRNCENAVKQIVDRICNQSFPHKSIEVLFVDDGSEDNTFPSIMRHASTMDIKYKVFNHNWKGLGYSRNMILKNARGDYVAWIDDGTLIPKNYLSKIIDFMENNPNIGVAKGYIGRYSGSNIVATLQNMRHLFDSYKYAGKFTMKLVGTAGSIYRVKAAIQVGGFNQNIRGAAEDNDIIYRILLAGWDICIEKIPFFIEYAKKPKTIWTKYFGYGYGGHFVFHNYKELRKSLYRRTPFAGVLEGILIFRVVYKITHRKIAFLLPMFISFLNTAWCLGFAKGHLDSYGH